MANAGGVNFRIWATARPDGALSRIEAGAATSTFEEAQRVAATFPKSVKLVSTHLSGDPDGQSGYVSFNASFVANGTNGGVNETGLRRYRTFRRFAASLGHEVLWTATFGNAVTEAEFERIVLSSPGPSGFGERREWERGGMRGPRI